MTNKIYYKLFLFFAILAFPSLSSADYSQASFTGYYSVNSQQAVTYGYNGPLWQAFGQTLKLPSQPSVDTPAFYLKLSAEDLGMQHDCRLNMAIYVGTSFGGYLLRPAGDDGGKQQYGMVYYVGGSDYASDPNNLVGHEVTVPFTKVEENYQYAPVTNLDQINGLFFTGLGPGTGSPQKECYHVSNWEHMWVDAAIKFAHGGDVIPDSGLYFQTTDAYTTTTTPEDLVMDIKTEGTANNTGKTPVLIVPGTLATEMWKGGEKIWMDLERMIKYPDSFMNSLAYGEDSKPVDVGLRLGEVIGQPAATYDYSDKLVEGFESKGYTLNKDMFFFPYDWRDDISKNANNALKEKIDSILSSTMSPQLDVIAHSQGGLVVKRLLYEQPEYQNKINNLVFVGTPNLGAPKSIKILRYGDDLNIKLFLFLKLNPYEIKYISRNMPSIYQMLPSKEYFNHSSGYIGIHLFDGNFYKDKVISTFDASKEALKQTYYDLNSDLLDAADNFHTPAYDNFDFSNTNIKVTNIMGCESPTIGKVFINGSGSQDDMVYEPGDGTVPLISASNIGGAKNYYVLNTGQIHGTMLTTDGIREKIVNVISGSNDKTSNITTNPALCVFKGKKVEVHSPVELHIYDEVGNHVGPLDGNNFDYQIPEVAYDEIGHGKYAFLPDGHNYTVKLVATNAGSFSFKSTDISNADIISIAKYDDITITSTSTAELVLNDKNNQIINFTSDHRAIPPTAILDQYQSLDAAPPVSTSTLSGLMGESGFYRSDVKVSLSSQDPVIPGLESQTSGLYRIYYKLDDSSTTSPYSVYDQPFAVSSEGLHSLSFFAADKAGNNETPQTLYFTIDKTPPELVMRFDPSVMDLAFAATDASPAVLTSTSTVKNLKTFPKPKIKLTDRDSIITAIDSAGNTTVLTFKDRDRKQASRAEIKSLSYNSQPANIGKAALSFAWTVNRKQDLSGLVQSVSGKKDFNILAVYSLNRTVISGRDQSGRISQSFAGLKLLRVFTSQGDIGWGIE